MARNPKAVEAIRSRIVGHGDVKVDELLANPLNFRTHPGNQMDALRGSMKELGWLKTILINETTGHILDGHARVKEAMRQGLETIPATLVELTAEEERLALAVLDPITEMANRDESILADLLAQLPPTDDAGLQALLDEMAGKEGPEASGPPEPEPEPEEDHLAVAVPCCDGVEQADVMAKLAAMGFHPCLATMKRAKGKKKGAPELPTHLTVQ